MPVVQAETLSKLQHQGAYIRNICILAHVDHGKTSLTDALIATNGIISPKMAGKIRYLDSRPDEQLRGITMESSAISLYFSLLRRTAPDAEPEKGEFLVNLIDSPGHIDFSSEVSTASRLCDGALVLVDAVEGVCSQTVTVLRQAWTEKLKPILVINKMDRLITELKLTPSEAYTHLSKLIEQVNAVVGSFALGERMEDDLRWRERIDEKLNASAAAKDQDALQEKDRKGKAGDDEDADMQTGPSAGYEEKDDDDIYFEPERNNVIFSSAIDGWAFTPRQFAGIYEKKLGMKRSALEKVLWGDYYLDPKTRRVLGAKHLKGRNLKPMFVQLVLEQVWAAYEATVGGSSGKGDPVLLEKITKSLNITIPAHLLRSRDPKALLSAVFAAWLPLSTAVLVSVIEHLPSPKTAQESRIPALLDASPGSGHIDSSLRESMIHMNAQLGEPTVAYISKMISIPESELPTNKRRGGALTAEEARELGRKKRAEIARAQAQANEGTASIASVTDALSAAAIGDDDDVEAEDDAKEDKDDPEHLIGFARLYSGTLTVGDEVFVLPPKFTPANPHVSPQPRKVTITGLFLLMGRSLETLNSVPAGNVVGIAGLEGAILKSGTISSRLEGSPNLSSTSAISTNAPIVRVALEPTYPGDLDKMIKGLHLLEQADPAVSYEQLESGEHVILTAGELHLERCLKDLKDRFAKCDIQAGEAIVPYRESIVKAEEMNAPRDPILGRGRGEELTSSKQVRIRLSVRPLPLPVTEFLVRHTGAVKRLYSERKAQEQERATNDSSADKEADGSHDVVQDPDGDNPAAGGNHLTMAEFKHELSNAFAKEKADKEIWKDVVEKITAFGPRRIGPNLLIDSTSSGICGKFLREESETVASDASPGTLSAIFADKISHAFQLETNQGPLCHEPMQGIAVFLEDVSTELGDEEVGANAGRLTGEIIRTAREIMRQGFLDWSPRILLAMYSCEIQASAEVLGRVYSVITRRRGRIVSESLLEPSTNFTILALLPVAESFGFSDEIRQRTSGFAAPQLVFEGYEMLDEDPFWVPFTEEELEDLGEKADKENVAKRYVDAVRERKGLAVKRKVVESAEKQKTLKR